MSVEKNFKDSKEYLEIYNSLNIENERAKSMQASKKYY